MAAGVAARTVRRPGRLALVGGIGMSLGLAGIAAAWAHAPVLDDRNGRHRDPLLALRAECGHGPARRAHPLRHRNTDPIDHEWIVGDAAVHARHRTGTEPVHGARPTEVTIPAGPDRDDT